MPWRDWDEDEDGWGHPRRVKNGITTRSTSGAIGETWWSRRWVNVLESFGIGSRLSRGRSYARQGQVVSIDVESGLVKAKVQGSQPRPYSVKIKLKPLAASEWEKVTEAMAGQAIFAAKLLAGEMPQNIEEAFATAGVALFPVALTDLETECSCPDWSNPCKHIAAVYYLLADQFDEDPFLIFKLRGRTKEQIIKSLRAQRAASLAAESDEAVEAMPNDSDQVPPLEECLATFWLAGDDLATFAVHPAKPEVDNALLQRLGNAPFTVGDRNISAPLSRITVAVSDAALEKASGENG